MVFLEIIGDSGPVLSQSELEEYLLNKGALVSNVKDWRTKESFSEEVLKITFSDPDHAVASEIKNTKMNFFKALNIVRPINLLILAFTQILCRLSITNVPFLENLGIHPMLSNSYFALLVLSTLLIAAGGYIINDIADIDIDTVNKPEKVIVNKYISEAMAMKMYMAFSFLGLLLGGILAWHVEMKQLVMLHVMMVAFLFFYANLCIARRVFDRTESFRGRIARFFILFDSSEYYRQGIYCIWL